MPSRLDIDTDSATWRSIKDWATEKLATCRKRNDGPLPMEQTTALRGEIVVLKELLALEIVPAQISDGDRIAQMSGRGLQHGN